MTALYQHTKKTRQFRTGTIVYCGVAVLAFVLFAAVVSHAPSLDTCATIANQDQRLACFDSFARQNERRPTK